uniref:Parathyroid hormone n=1 Tax=Erpetoichthys calabaricus TaxID=27687 RepID=A0A8C4RWP2_ERPCA
MISIRYLLKPALLLFLLVLCYIFQLEGRPVRRSISEMQLMHNLGEHRHAQQREEWLETKLKDIHTALLKNTNCKIKPLLNKEPFNSGKGYVDIKLVHWALKRFLIYLKKKFF